MNDLQKKIEEIFAKTDILFGFTKINFGSFKGEYRSALIFAVPYTHQLSLKNYRENLFNDGILGAKEILEKKVEETESLLKAEGVKYYIPEVAQKDDGRFCAEFSFKDAAADAGIGWFGKNDVIITEKYGPRVRLSAVLIDCDFEYSHTYEKSLCPDGCDKCIKVCPAHAFLDVKWEKGMVRDDIIDITRCNRIRSSFYDRLGRWGACALCLAVCPYGSPQEI
ncbi:MAG: epoxyqueuosine reductase [Ruminiclostridium sp.]|nr:epoxyqueuosine reductase [Ruminiclostridium sp.]